MNQRNLNLVVVGAVAVLLLGYCTSTKAAVWACPTKPVTYQDTPCGPLQGTGREVEVRGTVVSLNVAPAPVYTGPHSFTVGRRSDDLPSTSSMIDAYRADTSIRNFDTPVPSYNYGIPVYINNLNFRNRLQK